jgi:hypothetical protein
MPAQDARVSAPTWKRHESGNHHGDLGLRSGSPSTRAGNVAWPCLPKRLAPRGVRPAPSSSFAFLASSGTSAPARAMAIAGALPGPPRAPVANAASHSDARSPFAGSPTLRSPLDPLSGERWRARFGVLRPDLGASTATRTPEPSTPLSVRPRSLLARAPIRIWAPAGRPRIWSATRPARKRVKPTRVIPSLTNKSSI